MSEGVVTFLLTKLGDFLAERGKQLTGVQGEVEYISDELEFMLGYCHCCGKYPHSNFV